MDIILYDQIRVQYALSAVFPLTCKAPGGGCRAGAEARLAAGFVQQLAELHAAAVDGDVGAARQLSQRVVRLPADTRVCTYAAVQMQMLRCFQPQP